MNLGNTACPQLEGLIYLHKGTAHGLCAHGAHGHTHPFPAPAHPYASLNAAQLHPSSHGPQMWCCTHAPSLQGHRRPTRMKQRGSCTVLCWSWSCLSSQDPHWQAFSTQLLPQHCLHLGLHLYPCLTCQTIFTKACWVNRVLCAPVFRKTRRGVHGLLEKPMWLFLYYQLPTQPPSFLSVLSSKMFLKRPNDYSHEQSGGKGGRTYRHQRCESWALWALASGWTPPASLPPWCDTPACVQCDGLVQTAANLHCL